MDINVSGVLTVGRLREVLALIEAGSGVTCFFEGRLRLFVTNPLVTGKPRADIPTVSSGAEADQSNWDVEDEDEDENDNWNGPLPAYMGGVEDNSPEAIERRRLFEEKMQNQKRQRAEEEAMRKRLSREHTTDKELFGRLRVRFGQPFIDAINAEIAEVWREVQPVYSKNTKDGKDGKAGQPRLMPQLELRGETVSFHGFNLTGTTMRVSTPVSISDKSLGSRPLWMYKEWAECAVPRIKAVVDAYAEKAQLVRVVPNN